MALAKNMNQLFKRKKWTTEEIETLIRLFPHYSNVYLGEIFGVSINAINAKATKYGLKKSPERLAEFKKKRIELINEISKKYQFKKGQIPHNKGQKMPFELREKIKHTFIKKGQILREKRKEGEVWERKNQGFYTLYQGKIRKYKDVVWIRENGQIPKGQIVVHLDRNKFNVEISNLAIINRKGLLEMNTIQRFPKEMREVICLHNKLKIRLKNYTNGNRH